MITPALRKALTKQGEALPEQLGTAQSLELPVGRAVGGGLWGSGTALGPHGRPDPQTGQDTRRGWGWKGLWRSPRQGPPEQVAQEWHRGFGG